MTTPAIAVAKRLRSVMGLMARDNDNEAVVALRHATRMLKEIGRDWSDVADLVLCTAPGNDAARQTCPQPAPQPRPQPTPPPAPREVSGHSIPARVAGRIVIQAIERTGSGGIMAEFLIDAGDTIYGPMVAYTTDRVWRISVLWRKKAHVEMHMLKPGQGRLTRSGFMPQVGTIIELS